MSPTIKKILYGIFYLALLLFLSRGLFRSIVPETISCTDGKQNGAETGIDCGGGCILCAIKNLAPLELQKRIRLFPSASGFFSVIGEIVNRNSSYFALTDYVFDFFDDAGNVIDSFSLNVLIPSEKKVVVYGLSSRKGLPITRAALRLKNVEWKETNTRRIPEFPRIENATTTFSGDQIRVSGLLRNESSDRIQKLTLITLLSDSLGNELFAGATEIENIESFSTSPFAVLFPSDALLARSLNASSTQFFFLVQ